MKPVKSLKMVIIVILLLSVPTWSRAEGESMFSDTAGHWAAQSIEAAVQKGYVSGYPDGTFQPNKDVTRAEFMRMLVDALKLPRSQGGSPWYQPFVAALVEIGIHLESDYKSDYNKPLTRLEMAKLAVRATDLNLQASREQKSNEWFMYEATTKGIIHGMTHGELVVDGLSTRAQAVAIIERILAVNEGITLATDKRAITYAEVDLKGNNIESAWGIKLKPLPIYLDVGRDAEAFIDRVILVDMGDENAAYRHWFPEVIKSDKTLVTDEDYIVALHVRVINKNLKDNVTWIFSSKIVAMDVGTNYREAVIKPEYQGKTPIWYVPPYRMNRTEEVEGWLLMAISKTTLAEKPYLKEISVFNVLHGRPFYLTEEQ